MNMLLEVSTKILTKLVFQVLHYQNDNAWYDNPTLKDLIELKKVFRDQNYSTKNTMNKIWKILREMFQPVPDWLNTNIALLQELRT